MSETAVLAPASRCELELDLLAHCQTFEGFHTKACCVSFGDGVRGMAAASDIKAGEEIVAIPRALLVCPGGKGIHALYQWLADRYDQDPASDDAYFRSIRSTPVTCAADFLPSQVAHSQTLTREVAEAASILAEARHRVSASPGAVAWAYCVVATRACFYDPGGSTPVDKQALLPWFDLINHHTTHDNCEGVWEAGRQVFVARATRAIKVGQQVFLSYGHLPNALLLMRYGFALPNNPHDAYGDFTAEDLLAGLSPTERDGMSRGAAMAVLAGCGCAGANQFYVSLDGGVDYTFRVVVRVSVNLGRLPQHQHAVQAAILDEEWLDEADKVATNARLRLLLQTRAAALRKVRAEHDHVSQERHDGLRECLDGWLVILDRAHAACT